MVFRPLLLVDADADAYPHSGDPIPGSTGAMSTGCYAAPQVFARVRTIVTNTPPTTSSSSSSATCP